MVLVGAKLVLWWPYRAFFQVKSVPSFLKLVATILITWPPATWTDQQQLVRLAGKDYLVDRPAHPKLIQLFKQFPPPAKVLDPKQSMATRMEVLARFVSCQLPKTSPLPSFPEPSDALTLLGKNQQATPYAKICSKDAKIFAQYAAGLGYYTRLVQLKSHIIASVFDEQTESWKAVDPYNGCLVRFEGRWIASEEAHDLIKQGHKIDYCGYSDQFESVIITPRTNFASGTLPRWHYLHYDNLSYWRRSRPREK
jgi:hypothetical protein